MQCTTLKSFPDVDEYEYVFGLFEVLSIQTKDGNLSSAPNVYPTK